jgi:TetR/AcrR family transcriptional regulator
VENEERILDAALEEFSVRGFRGATIDRIAEHAGMSKPNLLYYFRRKQRHLRSRLISPPAGHLARAAAGSLIAAGDPLPELQSYIRRKLEMARDFPRESRLFANEILQGAPRIKRLLESELKPLVDEKARGAHGLDERPAEDQSVSTRAT